MHRLLVLILHVPILIDAHTQAILPGCLSLYENLMVHLQLMAIALNCGRLLIAPTKSLWKFLLTATQFHSPKLTNQQFAALLISSSSHTVLKLQPGFELCQNSALICAYSSNVLHSFSFWFAL